MKADYDSQGDTIQIELEPVKQAGYGEDVENGAVVVSVFEGRPVMLDVIGTRNHDFEKPLRTAAQIYRLDAESFDSGRSRGDRRSGPPGPPRRRRPNPRLTPLFPVPPKRFGGGRVVGGGLGGIDHPSRPVLEARPLLSFPVGPQGRLCLPVRFMGRAGVL